MAAVSVRARSSCFWYAASPQRPTISCGGKAGGSVGTTAGAAGCSGCGRGPVAQPESPNAKKDETRAVYSAGRLRWLIPIHCSGQTTLEGLGARRKRTLASELRDMADAEA